MLIFEAGRETASGKKRQRASVGWNLRFLDASLYLFLHESLVALNPDKWGYVSFPQIRGNIVVWSPARMGLLIGSPKTTVGVVFTGTTKGVHRHWLEQDPAASGEGFISFLNGERSIVELLDVPGARVLSRGNLEINGTPVERTIAETPYGELTLDRASDSVATLAGYRLVKGPESLLDQLPLRDSGFMPTIQTVEVEFIRNPPRDLTGQRVSQGGRLELRFMRGAYDESIVQEFRRVRVGDVVDAALLDSVPMQGTRVSVVDGPRTALQYVWDGEKPVPLVPTTQIAMLDDAIRNAAAAQAPAPDARRYDWKTIAILGTLAVLCGITSLVLLRKSRARV